MNNRIRTGVTTDVVLISLLQEEKEGLRKTVPDNDQNVFWEAVKKLLDNTGDVYDNISLMSWDWLLPIDSADPFGIAIRVFSWFSAALSGCRSLIRIVLNALDPQFLQTIASDISAGCIHVHRVYQASNASRKADD